MTASYQHEIAKEAERIDAETLERKDAPQTHPEFDRLVRTIWRLRQEDGCPWDKVQTHESILRNLVEEAYEAYDAILANDHEHMLEEFGDLLEQVLLHAQIDSDDGGFSIDDICRELNEKLVRRHPHVFGELDANNAEEALDRWDEIKKLERATAGKSEKEAGLLDSIPHSLPALMQCQKVSQRAAKMGFEWESEEDVWKQFYSEVKEFNAEERGSDERFMEFGDMLFALINVARWNCIDAEAALRASTDKFRARWKAMESEVREEDVSFEELSAVQWSKMWFRAKAGNS